MILLRIPLHRPPLIITTQIPTSSSSFALHFHLSSIKSPISTFLSRRNLKSRLYAPLSHFASVTGVSDEGGGFEEELSKLLALIPENMRTKLASRDDLSQLIEIVMDLGRTPLARFPTGDFVLSPHPISFSDLQHATSQVGEFAVDNRAGISRTLHRISAIRNRNGVIVGLTCRVGRAVTGSADSLRELVKDGASLLLIGPPGVGKTTIIREISRMLAVDYKKRVMIVDTSNEIGGDGDIPHPGIGNARRMQVPNSEMQHKVLIEAVENHMPQAIVIDEIGTQLEAMAASTIAQRGIQLVATAHGVTIENLIMNPSLDMLVGGIQSVTLGDEEASRRGGQKTVLERKGPSTFTCAIEIISKSELRVHQSLEATVDALLSGWSPPVSICKKNSYGKMETLQNEDRSEFTYAQQAKFTTEEIVGTNNKIVNGYDDSYNSKERMLPNSYGFQLSIRLYVYGISGTSVLQAIKKMKMDDLIQLSQDISESDVFLALQSKLKKHPQVHTVAKSHNLPIYVTKTSSLEQITKAIRALVTKQIDETEEQVVEDLLISSEKADALEEARLAIEKVIIPNGDPVELLPRQPHVLSAQLGLIRKYHLKSEKVGKDPDAFIRILPVRATAGDRSSAKQYDSFHGFQDYGGSDSLDSSHNGVDQLPFLPD